jgi:hypothetical protein
VRPRRGYARKSPYRAGTRLDRGLFGRCRLGVRSRRDDRECSPRRRQAAVRHAHWLAEKRFWLAVVRARRGLGARYSSARPGFCAGCHTTSHSAPLWVARWTECAMRRTSCRRSLLAPTLGERLTRKRGGRDRRRTTGPRDFSRCNRSCRIRGVRIATDASSA